MPMPHRTQMQLIKRRLAGKDGSARIRELQAILTELPDYKNGPYADIRKWLNEQIAGTRRRGRVVHRDSIAVPKEGAAQIALVGPPNAGKSSLLQGLSRVQIKTGDYAFTTTRPVPALTRIGGALVQLVEIPGLIEGAREDRGGGRALLGVLRGADAMVLCHPAGDPLVQLHTLRAELEEGGIDLPTIVAITKSDEARPGATEQLARKLGDLEVVAVSILDDPSLDRFRDAVWRLTGLIRIFLRRSGEDDGNSLALRPPVSVLQVAHSIHHEVGEACRGARLWGPSARFQGQRVGRDHVLADGDRVEILT